MSANVDANAAAGTGARDVIAMPRARRVRLFCAERLPALVFAAGAIAAAVLWQGAAAAPTLVAEVRAPQAVVKSVQAGTLTGCAVRPSQRVRAGEVLGRIVGTPPEIALASLARIRAEIAFLHASLEPLQAGRRLAVDQERLRLDWLRERVALAAVRTQWHEAEATLTRLRGLHEKHLVADEEHERALVARDGLARQVEAQASLVDSIAPAARRADLAGSEDATLRAAVALQEETLRLTEAQLAPVTLSAPIDGVVVSLLRVSGEVVAAGEPICTIASPRAAEIVGYLRQPLVAAPRIGTKVEVRTRSRPRLTATAEVVQVGETMEPIAATLLVPAGRAEGNELALRVQIAVPGALALRPGEQVDVRVRE